MDQRSALIQMMLKVPPDKMSEWINSLSPKQKESVTTLLTPRASRYNPVYNSEGKPFELTPKQRLVALLDNRTLLMSGSGGGGKTITLLWMALQWADHPKYSGLIIMRNLKNFEYSIRVLKEWLYGTGAVFNEVKKTWSFPEGGSLQLGHLDRDDDIYDYKTTEYHYVAFDELTRFKNRDSFKYLYSRMRKIKGFVIPMRIRAATNPGDVGGPWVYEDFIDPETRKQGYIHVSMSYLENSFLDAEDYELSLQELGYLERQRLQYGDWEASEDDAMIKSEWFTKLLDNRPEVNFKNRIRVWDIASTIKNAKNKDPDFTVGALCSVRDGVFCVENITRFRGTPHDVETKILDTYEQDKLSCGYEVNTVLEMGNNSAAKVAIDQFLRGAFQGMNIRAISSNVSKEERARPFAVAAENGYVELLKAQWNKTFLEEVRTFPKGTHDDQVDAVVYAYTALVVNKRRFKAKVTSFAGRSIPQYSSRQRLYTLR